jgi:hypothetical protein
MGVEAVARACPALVGGSCPAKCGLSKLPYQACSQFTSPASLPHSLPVIVKGVEVFILIPRYRTSAQASARSTFLLPVRRSAGSPRALSTLLQHRLSAILF